MRYRPLTIGPQVELDPPSRRRDVRNGVFFHMQTSQFFRRYLAAVLLIVVACVHIYQHRTLDRSAWGTGCGFGMFSTVDYHGTRHLKCVVTTADGEKELSVPTALSLRARALPTRGNLDVLANQLLLLAEHRWPSTCSVELELWCTNFDAQSARFRCASIDRQLQVRFSELVLFLISIRILLIS